MTTLLTIDDAPSTRFAEKLSYLTTHGIPGVWFVWSEKALGNEDLLFRALDQARDQVARTDDLIAGLYQRSGRPWRQKWFRFPYFDAGNTHEQRESYHALLRNAGYAPPLARTDGRVDTGCTFDQREYHLGNPSAPEGLGEASAILARFKQCLEEYRALGLRFSLP